MAHSCLVLYCSVNHQGAIHRPMSMMSASLTAPLGLVSTFSPLSLGQRSARSLLVFSSFLKLFTFLASLVAAGSLFQLFTTLWLKKCPLASVFTLFASILLLSLVALVTLSPFSAAILNQVFLSTLSTFAMILYVCIISMSFLLSSSVSNPISLHFSS